MQDFLISQRSESFATPHRQVGLRRHDVVAMTMAAKTRPRNAAAPRDARGGRCSPVDDYAPVDQADDHAGSCASSPGYRDERCRRSPPSMIRRCLIIVGLFAFLWPGAPGFERRY